MTAEEESMVPETLFFPAVAADAVAAVLSAEGYEVAVSADYAGEKGAATYVEGRTADPLRNGDGSAARARVRVSSLSTRDTSRAAAVAALSGILSALDPRFLRAEVEAWLSEALPGWHCTRVAWAGQGEEMQDACRVYFVELDVVISAGEMV